MAVSGATAALARLFAGVRRVFAAARGFLAVGLASWALALALPVALIKLAAVG
ncbi:MAG: hypothetical protein HKL95_09655 [Phycisphaerae bacterium]|nr:hypothetical protein [Phycisphaerae bacterium]